MNQDTWNQILLLCDEIEALLKDAAPVADKLRLQRIEFLCARMCGHETYVTEKANKIARRAAICLSARKHQSEPQGAEGLMHDMRYSYLSAIREQAQWKQGELR